MPKYKVLLPTNGFEVGSEVELSEEQAANFNGGEPTPRVQLVVDAAASGSGEAPQNEGGEAPPQGEQPPANDETQTPPASDDGANDGAGSGEGEGTGEGGAPAGENA